MTAQTAVQQPQSPDSLLAFLKLLLIGMLKKLPLKLLLAGAVALFAWILHTYLLVVTNEGFNSGNSFWLDRILALQGRSITGTLVWTFGVGLITSTIARIWAYGFNNTIRSVIETPRTIWNWANELGILGIPFLFAGFFLTIFLGLFISNGLLLVQLLLIVVGILVARHTSIFMTVLRLGFSDLQKLAKRETLIPFKLAWPGIYLIGVLVGLLVTIPNGLWAWVCGCVGFLLLVLASVGLFVNSPTGTKGVFGRKIFFWILPPLFLLMLMAVRRVFADDGGWLESGGTFSGWISSPGAGKAVVMGFLPAAGSGLGVLFGTAMGSMVSIIGAAGIPPVGTHVPAPKGTLKPSSKTAGHAAQHKTDLGGAKPGHEAQPGSRTADHQAGQLDYQEQPDPGQLSSRHKPGDMADSGSGSPRSDRAGYNGMADSGRPGSGPAKGAEAKGGGIEGSRSGEGMSGTETGQRDVRGVEPTTSSGSGTGQGAADSAGRAAGFDQDRGAGQISAGQHKPDASDSGGQLADRHRAETADSGSPLADRNRPGRLDEASERPAGLEQPGLRAERHTPQTSSSGSPTASRHEPGGPAEVGDKPAGLEQPDLRAERHAPESGGSPLADRHDPGKSGGAELQARHAPVENASPRADRFTSSEAATPPGSPPASRHSAPDKPVIPIPPAPVPGYVLDWELVVVRTPQESGIEVQQRFELEGKTVIGRHGKIDIMILDPKVSRQHADIEVEGSSCRITDLNSSNGTFVNGRRIKEPVELQHGDAVKIGDTYFVIQQKAA